MRRHHSSVVGKFYLIGAHSRGSYYLRVSIAHVPSEVRAVLRHAMLMIMMMIMMTTMIIMMMVMMYVAGVHSRDGGLHPQCNHQHYRGRPRRFAVELSLCCNVSRRRSSMRLRTLEWNHHSFTKIQQLRDPTFRACGCWETRTSPLDAHSSNLNKKRKLDALDK